MTEQRPLRLAVPGVCPRCGAHTALLVRRSRRGLRTVPGACPWCGVRLDVDTQRTNPVPWWGWVGAGIGLGIAGSVWAFRPLRAVRSAAVAGLRDLRRRPPGRPPGAKTQVRTAVAQAVPTAPLADKIAAAERELGVRTNPSPSPALVSRLRAQFRDFHGVDPRRVRFVRLPDFPQGAWLLGKAETISYIPPRYSTRSEGGKAIEFVHAWGDTGGLGRRKERPLLLASVDGRQLILYRQHSRFQIGPRGIVG